MVPEAPFRQISELTFEIELLGIERERRHRVGHLRVSATRAVAGGRFPTAHFSAAELRTRASRLTGQGR
jgi:hypothetical protein